MSLKLVRVVAFALALLACAVALVLAGLERSGWLAGRAREELRRALGPDARVESVALDWFAPAIELRGLEFGDSDGSLRIESLRVAPRWSSGGVAIARIDSFGGRLRLSNALVARIESALAGSERTSAAIPGSAVAPTVVVEALEFSFLHPTAGELEIGRVDALSHAGEDGRARIEGRVTPSFSALRGPHSPHVFLAGQRYAGGGFEVVASCSGIPLEASALPPALRQPALEGLRPRGRLEFELSARFQLDAAAPAEGAL